MKMRQNKLNFYVSLKRGIENPNSAKQTKFIIKKNKRNHKLNYGNTN